MRNFLQFTLLCLSLLSCQLYAENTFSSLDNDPFASEQAEFLPVTDAYEPLLSLTDSGVLQLQWRITEAYYLYQERFATEFYSESGRQITSPDYGPAIIKDDPYFGATPVYYDFANTRLTQIPAQTFLIKLTAQGCADAGLCYPPHDWFFEVNPQSGAITAIDNTIWIGATSQATTGDAPAATHLGLMLLFALAGGIILNLMPCVFPVLGLKVLSFSRSESGTASLHGAIYSLGVIASFVVVALVLIALKSAGAAIGWGFQLQTPWFVALLSCVFFVLSLNLLGVFEFRLTGTAPGQTLSQRSDYVGSFFTGVLATIVATPCTAPFMGTALGFAATQPTGTSLAIFATLGAGMALPVFVLTLFPSALKKLPRSGAWMDHLKQFLSFPLLATAIWLCWVVGRQSGADGMALTLLAWLALGIAIWLGLRQSTFAKGLALLSALAGLALLATPGLNDAQASRKTDARGLVYSAETVAELRAAGRPVFIDVTADWCITCKVNERVALHTRAVEQAFADKDVAYVVADWTRYDANITALLDDYQRNGIPLYLLYLPGRERARILPQILTESLVLGILDEL